MGERTPQKEPLRRPPSLPAKSKRKGKAGPGIPSWGTRQAGLGRPSSSRPGLSRAQAAEDGTQRPRPRPRRPQGPARRAVAVPEALRTGLREPLTPENSRGARDRAGTWRRGSAGRARTASPEQAEGRRQAAPERGREPAAGGRARRAGPAPTRTKGAASAARPTTAATARPPALPRLPPPGSPTPPPARRGREQPDSASHRS